MSEASAPLCDPAPHTPHRSADVREVIHRHGLVVRVTHWINVLCIVLLLMSGLQIFNAHPMLYWGRAGDDGDRPFVSLGADDWRKPHPQGITRIGPLTLNTTGVLGVSSGEIRGYPRWLTLPADRNLAVGRRWHFLTAWVFVINGLIYLACGAVNGHFRRDIAPTREQLKPGHIWRDVLDHIQLKHPVGEAARRYNVLQKFAYLGVLACLILMALTGLTMSPGVDAFAPVLPILFGGRQSARTIHWICANLIVLFVLVHVAEVFIAGAANEIGSMITGRYSIRAGERP
ncbi:MAG: cytochrome b/b6 domain-containing protein [Caulobacteraceae bacterium]|nr:cytochrome b/b6 domain-containing protein [Caulobacteraceae bacterium]